MSGFIATIVVATFLGVVFATVIPPVSRRRNVKRAKSAGARWVGLANFDASQTDQAPVVQQALSGTGPLYGSSLSPVGRQKPVGGLLYVFDARLRWEPTIWLGRGKAAAWEVPMDKVSGVQIARRPLPAIRSYEATIATADGDIRFLLVDPRGLGNALHQTSS